MDSHSQANDEEGARVPLLDKSRTIGSTTTTTSEVFIADNLHRGFELPHDVELHRGHVPGDAGEKDTAAAQWDLRSRQALEDAVGLSHPPLGLRSLRAQLLQRQVRVRLPLEHSRHRLFLSHRARARWVLALYDDAGDCRRAMGALLAVTR